MRIRRSLSAAGPGQAPARPDTLEAALTDRKHQGPATELQPAPAIVGRVLFLATVFVAIHLPSPLPQAAEAQTVNFSKKQHVRDVLTAPVKRRRPVTPTDKELEKLVAPSASQKMGSK